ncbi:MAG TPA: hypothetical protein VL737_04415 [Candidatus Pristimantibacillus sp.]|jgi:hypothetical protein|nr:hypothetical protein [Candidatus Pristimantibacillus sp.]
MSNKEQTPTKKALVTPENLRRGLIVVALAIVAGTLWYVWQTKDNTDKTLKDAKAVQTAEKNNPAPNAYADWTQYKWTDNGVSFKYPKDWFVSENKAMGRVYVKNSQVDLLTQATPDNFQQVWLSVDPDETYKAREDAIKQGQSDFHAVKSAVKASTVTAGGVTINLYTYDTTSGPAAEAYWTNKAGTRVLATTSTGVGQQNQTDMVATLKKLLATVSNL